MCTSSRPLRRDALGATQRGQVDQALNARRMPRRTRGIQAVGISNNCGWERTTRLHPCWGIRDLAANVRSFADRLMRVRTASAAAAGNPGISGHGIDPVVLPVPRKPPVKLTDVSPAGLGWWRGSRCWHHCQTRRRCLADLRPARRAWRSVRRMFASTSAPPGSEVHPRTRPGSERTRED